MSDQWVAQVMQEWMQKIEDAMREQMNTSEKHLTSSEAFTQEERDVLFAMKNKAFTWEGQTSSHINKSQLVIAGGCFYSFYHNEVPNDIDLFIVNDKDNNVNKWLRSVVEGKRLQKLLPAPKGYGIFNGAINGVYNDVLDTYVKRGVNLQYIHTSYKTREDLLSEFDLEHAKISWHREVLYASPLTLECISKKLLYASKAPSQARIKKFLERGFTWHPDSPFKL